MGKSQDVVLKTRSVSGIKILNYYKGDREQWMEK